MIDASGAHVVERLASRVRAEGAELVLAGITPGDRNARALRTHGAFARSEHRHWYPDVDRALEHAERRLLDAAGQQPIDEELPIERLPLVKTMTSAQCAALAAHLLRVELATHAVVFRRGEPGDRLYVLAKGSVSILADIDEGIDDAHRLASFAPGVVFGEAAMLDGGGRSASAVADEASVVYVLTAASLDSLRAEEPELAYVLLLNIARELSARLRFATATIQGGDR
jgi:CRP-like cAMP-binding protein